MGIKTILRDMYLAARSAPLKLIGTVVKKSEPSTKDIKSILAIRIDRIGDVIVSLPALKALRGVFPDARLTVLVANGNDALLSAFPQIDEIITYKGFMKTAGLLRKKGFGLAIDFLMDYPLKTALLAYLSKAKFTAGFNICGKGNLFHLGFDPGGDKKHVSLYMLDLVRSIAKTLTGKDYLGEDLSAELSIPAQDKGYAESLLREKGIQEKDIVVAVHPGGHYPSQRWPIERFARLAEMIIEKYKVKIIILGSPEEKMLVDRMADIMKGQAIKVIGLALNKLAGLISLADLFIGNNSGPWHIACALNIPTVSTMGPTDPVLWWPVSGSHIVVRKNLYCSPCNLAACGRHDCLKAISTDEMMAAVQSQLEKVRKQ